MTQKEDPEHEELKFVVKQDKEKEGSWGHGDSRQGNRKQSDTEQDDKKTSRRRKQRGRFS